MSQWDPALIWGFPSQNSDFWISITSFYGSQTSPVVLCMQNIVISTRINSLCGSQTTLVALCMQNIARKTSLHRSQTSPVVLSKQNKGISIRITSLYGSQHSSVVFACKTATLGPNLQVSMVPRPHLWLFAFKTATLSPEYKSRWVSAFTCCFVEAKQCD